MKKLFLLLAFAATTASLSAQHSWGVKAGAEVSTLKISAEGLSAKANPGNKAGFYVGGVSNLVLNKNFDLQTELMYSYGGTRLAASGDFLAGLVNTGNDPSDPDYTVLDKMSVAINTHTLRLPILIHFHPSQKLSILAGPYVSVRVGTGVCYNNHVKDALNASLAETGISADDLKDVAKDLVNDNLKKFDVGASLGVEYAFDCGLFIDARYNFSFLNSLKKKLDPTAINDFANRLDPDAGANLPEYDVKAETGVQPTVRYSALQVGVGFRF